MSKYRIRERTEWRQWVVPKSLYERPIHRWYVFPHSFTDDLVKALIGEWGLGEQDLLVDPFAGAGTAVLGAKELGVPAKGFDLSPLAVLATRVKVANYSVKRLKAHWAVLEKRIGVSRPNGEVAAYPQLVVDALRGKRLATLHRIKTLIGRLPASAAEKRFFGLALLAILPRFSRAVVSGGWLSWRQSFARAERIPVALASQVEMMLEDLERTRLPRQAAWSGMTADARQLPLDTKSCSSVVTSPPYPNRHDYTRVFGVELMFGFLDWDKTRALRYQLFHSHPEARPVRPQYKRYQEPRFVSRAIKQIADHSERERLVRMLRGYFMDLYLSLKEVHRILKPGGRVAYVVGNARYDGEVLEVDRATAAIGEQCGLVCKDIRLVRERGNSAQQMGRFGRSPSRESIVFFLRR